MQNPLDNGSQAFYQPYGDEISISQEEWQESQDTSPSLKSAILVLCKELRSTCKTLKLLSKSMKPL
jgi:hypothetical protein